MLKQDGDFGLIASLSSDGCFLNICPFTNEKTVISQAATRLLIAWKVVTPHDMTPKCAIQADSQSAIIPGHDVQSTNEPHSMGGAPHIRWLIGLHPGKEDEAN